MYETTAVDIVYGMCREKGISCAFANGYGYCNITGCSRYLGVDGTYEVYKSYRTRHHEGSISYKWVIENDDPDYGCGVYS